MLVTLRSQGVKFTAYRLIPMCTVYFSDSHIPDLTLSLPRSGCQFSSLAVTHFHVN